MEIGIRLREAREAKDISLDALQETTKIQKRYLVAIEEENFQVLPGKFYAKAFIKEYASAVGLDADELLADYKDEVPIKEDEEAVQYTRIEKTRKDSVIKNSNLFSLMPTIIVVLLVISIIFVAWTLYQKSALDNETDPVDKRNDDEIVRDKEDNKDTIIKPDDEDESEVEDKDEEEDEKPSESESEFTLVEKGTGNIPESTLELSSVDENVTVSLATENETYLEVKNEAGKSFFAGIFSAEESPLELDLTGEDEIYFHVGRSIDLDIVINGVELEYPYDPNEKVFQKIWVNINQASE